ncbi:MAG: hypothetical protein ACE5IH_07860, partial [Thermodesulfobacteriota bacterium]
GEEVYLYNHRTFNRFRGKYLFPALLVNIIKYLRDNDYNRVYALSYVKNNPSIKALKVAGFQESYVITFIKILWFKRYYYSDPIQR